MQLFYTENINERQAILEKEEMQHAVNVLRLKVGNEINFTDGKGVFYTGKIQSISKKNCIIAIEESKKAAIPESSLILAVAPTKNISRFEWLLEKCTEIGIHAFIPMVTENSERKIIKPQRLEKVIIAACKQSLKVFKPELKNISTFSEIINAPFDEGNKYIAHCYDTENKKQLTDIYRKAEKNLILIGPEGDFSPEEVKKAEDKGFKSIGLGNSRLRAETAAMVACHTIQLLNEMNKK